MKKQTKEKKASKSGLKNGSEEASRKSRLRPPAWKSQGETDNDNEASTILEPASNMKLKVRRPGEKLAVSTPQNVHEQAEEARSVTAEILHDDIVPLSDGDGDGDADIDAIDADDINTDINVELKSSNSKMVAKTSKAVTTADPMSLYLASIQKYPLLSREEEQKLALKYYETKDASAAQALVTANLRFVVKVAAEYSKFGAKLIDLVQEGNVGLMHAIREFNPYKGVRLITYAVWWIRGYIQEYLMRQYSLVRIGTTQNQRKLFYQLKREKEALDALGEATDYKQLSEKLGIPVDEIQDMQKRLSGRDISLDRPLDDETKTTLGDLQTNQESRPLDEELALNEQLALLKDKIEEIRPELSQRELIILDERLLADDPLTLQEIGEKYKITREAVRQMEVRVINKIKKKFLSSTSDNDEA